MINMVPIRPEEREDFLRMAVGYFSELNPGFLPSPEWKEHYFPNIISNPRFFLRWIARDGTRAGFILFGLENHRFLPKQNGVVYELYVLPEFRRHGIAKECANQAIQELWQYSPSKIQLEVLAGSSAAAFWRSVGFHKVTERFVLDRRER